MSESFVFTFALIGTGATIFLFVYFIITLSDLECDYLNSQQCCSKLNKVSRSRVGPIKKLNCIFEKLTNNALAFITGSQYGYEWVIPKLGAHMFLTILLFFYSQWVLALANTPLGAWLCYEYYTIPKGNMGVFDPTEIHNRGQLKKHMRDCLIFLGYYLAFFFIYLYFLIISLLKGNPLETADPEMTAF